LKKSKHIKFQLLLGILFLLSFSACIRPLEAFKEKDNYREGEITAFSDISDEASSYSHMIGFGMNNGTIQAGYDMSYLLSNKSRYELSANYNFGNANKRSSNSAEKSNYTDKRFTEAVSVRFDLSFPFYKGTRIKKGAIPLTDGRIHGVNAQYGPPMGSAGSSAPMIALDSFFYAVHDFKQIRTFDARIGIDHNYSIFGSPFYKRYLSTTYPEGIFRFPDNLGRVHINQGTYYLKAGVSMNLYANTHIDALLYGKKFWGDIVRELQATASFSYGLYSTISDLDLHYSSFEGGEFVEQIDRVNPMDYDLGYASLGWEISLSWQQYFYDSYVLKYRFYAGMAPGFFEHRGDNLIMGASLRFGIGKMRN
jgi:hypothetical protein